MVTSLNASGLSVEFPWHDDCKMIHPKSLIDVGSSLSRSCLPSDAPSFKSLHVRLVGRTRTSDSTMSAAREAEPGGGGIEAARTNVALRPIDRVSSILAAYSVALASGYWLAYQLRFDFVLPSLEAVHAVRYGLWIIPTKLLFLLCIGQFSGVLSHFSVPGLRRLLTALGVGSCVPGIAWLWTNGSAAPPRSVILSDFVFSFLFISAFHLCCRLIRERHFQIPSGTGCLLTFLASNQR